jgi:hypothetical protein
MLKTNTDCRAHREHGDHKELKSMATLNGLCSELIASNSASRDKAGQGTASNSGAALAGLDELLVVLARIIIIGVAVLYLQETAGLLILLFVALGMLDWPACVSGREARSREHQRGDLRL